VLSHLSQHSVLSGNQHRFISRSSCCTQLLSTLNDWTSAMDQGFSTDVIYFNFSKAFDSVLHNRLLNKLKGYGVDGKFLEWFKCFLVDRYQRVQVILIFLDKSSYWSSPGICAWSSAVCLVCE